MTYTSDKVGQVQFQAEFSTGASWKPALEGAPLRWSVVLVLDTVEQARELVASMPKSLRLRATTLTDGPTVWGYVKADASLVADGTNGGVNETGVKRYHAARRAFAKTDLPVEWIARYANSYQTSEAFEDALVDDDNRYFTRRGADRYSYARDAQLAGVK